MRAVIIALGCLATTFSLPTLASGQNQIAGTKAATQIFWNQLYSQGGTSLYCGQAFTGESGQLKVSPIYSSKQLKSALRCITNRQCSIMTPTYPYMTADLHNLYPALSRVELARRNAQFGELDATVLANTAQLNHPRYIGHMTQALPWVSVLAEAFTAALNQNQVKIETAYMSTLI